MVKVSVVVPVYNVENYIRDCLDSIVNQTLKDIEIICINDGSPDNSLEILKEYAAKDSRISVFDQENGGHAVATNRGIELAKGECLFLMDSDDVLELNALELSYNKLKEKDVDFVMFKAINYIDAEDRYYETEVYSMNKIYNKVGDQVFNYKDIGELMFQASVTPWSKLYKRDFINKENIRFPEGLIFEDNVFFYKALLTAKRICFLDEFLFIRRWYSTSSTTNGDLRFLNSLDVTNLMIDVFKENNEFDNYKTNLLNLKINVNLMRYNKIKKEFKEEFFQSLKADFIRILNDESFYSDFIEVANYRNKKILEQVIISENSIEFDRLRKIYDKQMDNYDLIDFDKSFVLNQKISNNKIIFSNLNIENKVNFFINLKQDFTKILNDENLLNSFIKNVNQNNHAFFKQVVHSENCEEFLMLRDLLDNHEVSEGNGIDFNKYISSKIKHIDRLTNGFNEFSFKELQSDLKVLENNSHLKKLLKDSVSRDNRKLFELVCISKDYQDFSQFRRIYEDADKFLHENLFGVDDEFKEDSFNEIKLRFNRILNNSFLFNELNKNAKYGNRKIFEQIIISENYLEFSKLRKVYDYQMKNPTLYNQIRDSFNVNMLIQGNIDALFRIEDEFKDDFFNSIRYDFCDLLNDSFLYEEFIKKVDYYNHKIFEQVIISENYSEFNRLRENYERQMESSPLIRSIDIKSLFNIKIDSFIKNLFNLPQNHRVDYFNNFANDLNVILQDEKIYDCFFNNLNYHNKKIVEQILISCDVDEFLSLRKIYLEVLNKKNDLDQLRLLKGWYLHLKKYDKDLSIVN